jgi:hypothetical protein
VNEREFVLQLCATLGDRAAVVVPRPQHDLAELRALRQLHLAAPISGTGPFRFPFVHRSLAEVAAGVARAVEPDLLVLRGSTLPLARRKLVRRLDVPYVIKRLGDGSFARLRTSTAVRPLALRNERMLDTSWPARSSSTP